MPTVVNLVSERKARAAIDTQQLRIELLERCQDAFDQLEDISGFALVVWDKSGDMRTAYNAASGPIGPALVPTLAADALNRHVAIVLATEISDVDSS
jgi:hypothetical protein